MTIFIRFSPPSILALLEGALKFARAQTNLSAMSSPLNEGPLHGLTIALPETREIDRMARILQTAGATIFRCPLVALVDPPDFAAVDAWLSEFARVGFDDLILLTGEGLRRLVARARSLGIHDSVLSQLGKARKITRGGKPARVLHELDLAPDIAVSPPTSQGVADTLRAFPLHERRVGLQLYGTDPNDYLVGFLKQAGAHVATVAPYAQAPASDAKVVQDLIRRLANGEIDAIAFTSAMQIDRLWEVALDGGLETDLRTGLERSRVAAMGPVVAEGLRTRNVRVDILPQDRFVMKRLTDAIVLALGKREPWAPVPPGI
jgi:uroporphyrinogen-III synthase